MFEGEKLNQSDSRYKTDTSEIDSSEMARTEQMTLIISNVSESDFGNYSCAVYTSLGMSVETILLAETKREMGIVNFSALQTFINSFFEFLIVNTGNSLTKIIFMHSIILHLDVSFKSYISSENNVKL